ncbi:MAG: ABC transporter ATP-binding protein [Candidatus Nephrothrix sp. EaCA]|nr:MAG: ABC transporter ATP-binding protein [Candidatus Nephrothrix sp. EaCA]
MKIVAQNLEKRYNRRLIFSLSAEFSGTVPYLVSGPNGSGKSTLLQILWGQMLPSRGALSYSFQGKNIEPENIFSYISIAAPYMDLIDEFTLEEMLSFHFRFKKLAEGITFENILKIMELEEHAHKKTGEFSSGMKQRAKLGLAFASDSPLLFLDEPCTNLDEKGVRWYQNQLEKAGNRLIIIASNQEFERPKVFRKIDLSKDSYG